MLLAIFNAIAALAATIPIFDSWLRQFIAWYLANQIQKMKAEDQQVMVDALKNNDQIPVEKLLGFAKAGKPSGVPGTEIVDSLPGVK